MAWMATDLSMGFATGFYAPIQNLAYSHSCFSKWTILGTKMSPWSKMFDSEFHLGADLHGAIFIWEILHITLEIYEVYHVCSEQYDDLPNQAVYWDQYESSHLAVASGDEENSTMDYVEEVAHIISFFVHGYEAYETYTSEYYHYAFGQNLGTLLADVLVFTQHYAGIEIFSVMPQWVRYLPESH